MDVDAWVRGFLDGMSLIQTSDPEGVNDHEGVRKFSLTHSGDKISGLDNSLELKLGPYVQVRMQIP